jgi:hypothetical protein
LTKITGSKAETGDENASGSIHRFPEFSGGEAVPAVHDLSPIIYDLFFGC